MSSLAPLPAPLGLNSNFIINQTVTLLIKDESGGDISILDQNGQVVIHCKAKFMSSRKRFTSPRGEHCFDLHKDDGSWNLEDPRGEKIGLIDGHWTLAKKELTIRFANLVSDGKEVTMKLRGKYDVSDAELTCNGYTVAVIGKQFGGPKQIFANLQTYGAQVAPGADLALVAAIICSLDLIKKKTSGSAITSAAVMGSVATAASGGGGGA